MIISDLNYLQTAEENVQGGYSFGGNSATTTNQSLNLLTNVTSKANVVGTLALSEADALATGPNTVTQTVTSTSTIAGVGSSSTATSASASQGSTAYWYL